MSFAEKLQISNKELVYLVKGKDKGRDAWYFIQVKNRATLPLFDKAIESGNLDLSRYGEIIHSGYGSNPPEYITDEIDARFGG